MNTNNTPTPVAPPSCTHALLLYQTNNNKKSTQGKIKSLYPAQMFVKYAITACMQCKRPHYISSPCGTCLTRKIIFVCAIQASISSPRSGRVLISPLAVTVAVLLPSCIDPIPGSKGNLIRGLMTKEGRLVHSSLALVLASHKRKN